MKMVSLNDFQNATGLSNEALLWLLKNNKLQISQHEKKGILVEISSVEKSELIKSMLHRDISLLEQNKGLIKERMSLIINQQLEELLDKALAQLTK